ncbi:hypothetical protein ACFLS9_07220 [Bacteroidota bacterium]
MITPIKNQNYTFAMQLIICLALIFFTRPQSANAQDAVEVFGYFESTFMGSVIDNKFYQLNTNKLRVDLKSDIYERVSFAANFNYINYNGKTSWNILDFLSGDITSKIEPGMQNFYTIPFHEQNFLDNAYFKLALEEFDIIAGRQQISLGTGYVWNPTDIFNIKDPLDPSYEQPGYNAVRVDVPLGTDYTISALYTPEENWQKSGKLILLKGRLSHFDITLLAIESYWLFHDYTQLDINRINFTELHQRRRLFGISTAGELLGIGTWVEYAYNKMDNFKDFYELVIGIDYTFDSQTYIMLEFYRNMLGKTDYNKYDLNDWMRLFASEKKAISRDQLYILVQHPVTDFITLGSSFIYSISDNSFAIVPTFNYSFSENVDIMAYLNTNIGKDGTAYSKQSGDGGIIRARVYF